MLSILSRQMESEDLIASRVVKAGKRAGMSVSQSSRPVLRKRYQSGMQELAWDIMNIDDLESDDYTFGLQSPGASDSNYRLRGYSKLALSDQCEEVEIAAEFCLEYLKANENHIICEEWSGYIISLQWLETIVHKGLYENWLIEIDQSQGFE